MLSAGKLIGAVVAALSQANHFEQAIYACLLLAKVLSVNYERQRDILFRRQDGEKIEELEHETYVSPAHERNLIVVEKCQGLPGQSHFAVSWFVQTSQEMEQRGLAAARRPHKSDELAFLDDEIDSRQGVHHMPAQGVLLSKAFRFRDWHMETSKALAADVGSDLAFL